MWNVESISITISMDYNETQTIKTNKLRFAGQIIADIGRYLRPLDCMVSKTQSPPIKYSLKVLTEFLVATPSSPLLSHRFIWPKIPRGHKAIEGASAEQNVSSGLFASSAASPWSSWLVIVARFSSIAIMRGGLSRASLLSLQELVTDGHWQPSQTQTSGTGA